MVATRKALLVCLEFQCVLSIRFLNGTVWFDPDSLDHYLSLSAEPTMTAKPERTHLDA